MLDSNVLWATRTGRLHSRNNILAGPDFLLFGTCGRRWNDDDAEDGVTRLDRLTGALLWFTPTGSDVNEIALVGENVLCPTDNGDVFVLCATSGEVLKIYHLDAPVLSKPLIWERQAGWEAIVISALGTTYWFSATSEKAIVAGSLNEPIRANILEYGTTNSREFIAATESGLILRCDLSSGTLKNRVIAKIEYTQISTREGLKGVGAVHASPTLESNRLYVGYTRDSYYESPPLICVNVETGEVIWSAKSNKREHFGNCRTSPIITDYFVISCFAYSDSLYIFDKRSGTLLKNIKLGQQVFQQWSAPILVSENIAVLCRVDGFVSIVDICANKKLGSIAMVSRRVEMKGPEDDELEGNFPLRPGHRARGICATPTMFDGTLYVGNTVGELAAIKLGMT